MKNNIDLSHKPKYKKCGIKYDIGIGILTKNPNQCTRHDLKCYQQKYWLWYEGYWYLIKKDINILELGKNCYSSEQFLEQLIDII